jgi:phosphate transport system substrate-binding protein
MKRIMILVLLMAITASVVCAAPSGSLKIAGSTTVLPISQLWAERFMNKYPNASISVSGGGSGVGLSSLLNGSCDIANSSRAAKKKEIDTAKSRNMQLTATRLCKDGLAIIVHSSNDLSAISLPVLAGIYSGKTTSWRGAGGKSSANIVVIGRDSSSGTFGYFQEAVLGNGPYAKDMLGLASNQAVAQAVAQSRNGIGYVGIAYAKEFAEAGRVKILSVSNKAGATAIFPSDRTIENGTYPLFRYLYAYTMGKPRGLAGDFLKYCASKEGQAVVPESGYLPL